MALPDTSNVLIIKSIASHVNEPVRMKEAWEKLYPLFKIKYNWDIRSDTNYSIIIPILPTKLLAWCEHGDGRWQFNPTTLEWSKVV